MKINLFRVKKKNNRSFVIEEDKYKNRLILFFTRHKTFVLTTIGLIIIMILLISTGLVFSLFGTSSDFDVAYIKGSEIVESNVDPTVDDEDIMTSIIGANTQGVAVLVEKIMTKNNDIISFFSDGVAFLTKVDGSSYKVYPTKDIEYGIDRDGNILDDVIRAKVTSTTNSLNDGSVITYYSDGSAVIERNGITIYTRNSKSISSNNAYFIEVNPSGVALESEVRSLSGIKAVKFSDGTYLIVNGDNKYVVNKNTIVTINGNNIEYQKYNSFSKIKFFKLADGNEITYFEDGSAVIEDANGKFISVNRSADIFMRDNSLYEIVTNNIGYSTFTKNTSNGIKVTYYDNGAAVLVTSDGKRYAVDSSDVIYDEYGNVLNIDEKLILESRRGTTINGDEVICFANNMSQIINSDGSSYITSTSNVKLYDDMQDNGDSHNDNGDDSDSNSGGFNDHNDDSNFGNNGDSDDSSNESSYGAGGLNESDGIYVSNSIDSYNYSKSIETTVFTISNRNKMAKKFRVVIEEVSDYEKFNVDRLEPKYVKFQALIGGEYISSRNLTSNLWTDSSGATTFLIYDGVVGAKSKITVNISLNVNYEPLDNSYQNKGFLGTIKVYLVDDE